MLFKQYLFMTLAYSFFTGCAAYSHDSNMMQTIQAEYHASVQISAARKMFGKVIVNEQYNPTLYAAVQEIAHQMGIKTPRVSLFKGTVFTEMMSNFAGIDFRMNAYARGLITDEITIGLTLLSHLTYKELRAVIAHELGHIKHNHSIKGLASYLGGYLAILGGEHLLRNYSVSSNMDTKKYLLINTIYTTMSTYALLIYTYKKSRDDEKTADREAFMITKNKDDLIQSLKKVKTLAHANHERSWLYRTFSTHPSIEEREEALSQLQINLTA